MIAVHKLHKKGLVRFTCNIQKDPFRVRRTHLRAGRRIWDVHLPAPVCLVNDDDDDGGESWDEKYILKLLS